jgi:hypothetical protein
MIRFIDLGKQIALDKNDPDWPREFAFYDTCLAQFISLDGQQLFDSVEDVIEQMDDNDASYVKRIVGLIPAWVPRGKRTMVR